MGSLITGCTGESVVRCRKCGGHAMVGDPFSFYGVKQAKDLPPEVLERAHSWSGRLVVENYPSVVSWIAPKKRQGYTHGLGVVRCMACYHQEARDISWPADAYYKWEIRGNTLWAYNLEHARVLLAFIASNERDENRFPGYEKSLRKLPTEFITAKVRDDVVKAISRTLGAEKD